MIHILFESPRAIWGQHLEVLVRQETLGGLAAVDRVEDLLDGAGLALGLEDPAWADPPRAKDLGLLLALGVEYRGLFDTPRR